MTNDSLALVLFRVARFSQLTSVALERKHRRLTHTDSTMPVRGSSWSRDEVEATVASYFDMLEVGLRGEEVNKTAYRNALLPLLAGRTAGAIERKHQNISAILIEERVPYISGYKPLGNYQGILREVVLDQFLSRLETRALIESEADRVPTIVRSEGLLEAWVSPPIPRPGMHLPPRRVPGRTRRPPLDYLQLEALNRALGFRGEEFVLTFERERLIAAGKERLAAQVKHTSVAEGDGAGYDILSYNEDSRERLIEVKTTKFGEYTPFYVSRNEVEVSRIEAPSYHLYRLYQFGPAPCLYMRPGPLDESFTLDCASFLARVN